MSLLKKNIFLLLLLLSTFARAENTYFIDGFHGGIYGHYPVEWYTQYMVNQMNEHPDWRINLEIEPETWDTVAVRTPEAYRLLQQKFSEGKQVEFCNPAYAQPYCYNILGESIIRQMSYGIDRTLRHFPDAKFLVYSSEEPCFTSCLPMVLSQFGFKYASLKCPDTCWGGYVAPYGGQLVNWVSSDGSSLLTVPRYECEDLQDNSTWQTTSWTMSDQFLDACRKAGIENPLGMCLQDAGWKKGPWLGRNRNKSTYTLWTPYFENCTPGKCDDDWHLTQDDIRVNLMWGSQVLQRIGQQVRRAELDMLIAEKLASICYNLSADNNAKLIFPELYKRAMDEGWRQLMLSQHHDSWIVPYNGFKHYGNWANAIKAWTDNASTMANLVTSADAELLDGPSSEPVSQIVRVFNTLGYDREEVVLSSDGKAFVATVPAMGYAEYSVDGFNETPLKEHKEKIEGDKIILENDCVKIAFDPQKGGAITSIRLLSDPDFEYVDTNFEQPFGTMKGNFLKKGGFHSSDETAISKCIYRESDLVATLTMQGKITDTPFTVTYFLTKGSPMIRCKLTIDWKENTPIMERVKDDKNGNRKGDRRGFTDDRYKLAMYFPMNAVNTRVFVGAPFDQYESQNDNTFFGNWSEIKNNIILNWVDLTDENCQHGLALLTDHTTTYLHGDECPLGLNVQYSGPGLWGRNYAIDGKTELNYALVPHGVGHGYSAISREYDNFTEPLQKNYGNKSADNLCTSSLCKVLTPNIHVSAATLDGDMTYIRLFNRADAIDSADGQICSIEFPGLEEDIRMVDLLGNTIETIHPENGVVSFRMPPMSIRTLAINSK